MERDSAEEEKLEQILNLSSDFEDKVEKIYKELIRNIIRDGKTKKNATQAAAFGVLLIKVKNTVNNWAKGLSAEMGLAEKSEEEAKPGPTLN